MAKELYRLKESLSNKPQLMLPSLFNEAFEYLNDRNNGLEAMSLSKDSEEEYRSYTLNEDHGVAVFDLQGAMTYRETFWQAMCGGVSYAKLTKDFEHLVLDKGVKTVVFVADSGGGEAYKMMPTANYLRQLANDNGVKIISAVDGMSASACYGITCISDALVLLEGSSVGSIGVVVQLTNNTKALEKAGLERSFIYAGKSKIPYTEDGEFTESFLSDIQASVETTYEEFTSHVAKHRSLSVEDVKSTEARMFEGEEAVTLGLADAVMTDQEFWTFVADVVQSNTTLEVQGGGSMPLDRLLGKTKATVEDLPVATLEDSEEMKELEMLQAAVAEKDAELSALAEAVAEKDALMAEMKETLETMQAQALQAKEDGRKEKLSAVLPEDQVEGMQATLSTLTDEQFNTVLAGLDATHKAKLSSLDFVEVGSVGTEVEADVNASVEEDATDKLIAQKYS